MIEAPDESNSSIKLRQMLTVLAKSVVQVAAFLLLSPAVCLCGAEGAEPTASTATSTFTDVTKSSGLSDALARHYERHPKWWLSGLNLVDLDGDGHVDLFLAAHGAGRSLALLNDGHGHFQEAPGSYPPTEIHLAYDINEDGKLDLQMTWQDGG